MDDREWVEELVDLIQTVSDPMPREALDLFREDISSLRRYLGSQAFYDDLLDEPSPLNLDTRLLFYVLFEQFRRRVKTNPQFRAELGQTLSESGADRVSGPATSRFFSDDELIRYLVEMLERFVKTDRVYQLPNREDERYRYVFRMIEAYQDSSGPETYRIFLHIGNYSLYLTGIFPDWIRHRHEYKNRPMDVDSYRRYGKTFFNRASRHEMARREKMQPVLTKLSRGYDLVRSSLEMIFSRLLPAFK